MYYLIYDEQGETESKTSFGQNTPSLGRVNILAIPPPHTLASLKNHLIKSENLSGRDVQIFEDEDSVSPMNDTDAIALLSDSFPGCMEEQPIAVTYEVPQAAATMSSSPSVYRGIRRKLVLAFDVGTTYSGISYRWDFDN